MFETNRKVTNPLIEPDSVRDTAANIAAVVTYLLVAEATLDGEVSGKAVSGRGLVLSCVGQAAEFISSK